MPLTTVTIGETDFDFEPSVDDFNGYLNAQMPNNKVAPAFNFLMASIKEEQKKDFKEVVMLDGKPNGIVVLQLVDVVAGEFNQGVSISLKKPKA